MSDPHGLEIPYDSYGSPAASAPPAPTTTETNAASEPAATSHGCEPDSSGAAISVDVAAASTSTPLLVDGSNTHIGDVLQVSLNGVDAASSQTALLSVDTGNGGSHTADTLLSVDAGAQGTANGGEIEGALIGNLSLARLAISPFSLLDDGATTSSPAQTGCADGHDASLVQIGLGDTVGQLANATSAPTQADGSAALLSIQSDATGADGVLLGNLLAVPAVSAEVGGSADVGGGAVDMGGLQTEHLLCAVGDHVDRLLAT